MKSKSIIIAATLVVASFASSQAQTTKTPVINQEQREQQAKIINGVKTGALTPKETRRLERQQAHIQQDKKIAKADGVVTPNERHHIKAEQRRAERNIRREKHDAQRH
jgi:hypothetical protein